MMDAVSRRWPAIIDQTSCPDPKETVPTANRHKCSKPFPKIIFCAIPEIIMLMIPNAGIIKM